MKLKGKTALVTGGGRGIGRTIALAYAKEGADIAVAARTKSEIEKVAGEIEDSYNRTCLTVKADITNSADVKNMVEETIKRLGRIDILVNNAGMTDKKQRSVKDLPEKIWRRIISINLTGIFLCSKAVLFHMAERKRGNIINITSLLGQKERAIPGGSAYCASKFGVEGLTEVLSKELKEYGINANTLYPAAKVNTGFFDFLPEEERVKLEKPEIMIEPAVFLATKKPGELTGQSINAKKWRDERGYKNKFTKG